MFNFFHQQIQRSNYISSKLPIDILPIRHLVEIPVFGNNMHWHSDIEICVFIKGSGTVVVNGEKYYAKAGEVYIVPSNALHDYYYDKSVNEETGQFLCFIINKDYLARFYLALEEYEFPLPIKNEKIFQLFVSMFEEFNNKPIHYEKVIETYLLQIFIEIVRNCATKTKGEFKFDNNEIVLVKDVIKYLDDNFSAEISSINLKKAFPYSVDHIRRVFKKYTGKSITQYVNNAKCNKAMEMLESKQYSVTEVAIACGFNNLSYFTKIFKRYTGLNPSEQKRKNKKEKTDIS